MHLLEIEHVWPSEVLMNLPQNAIEFLDAFIGCGIRYNAAVGENYKIGEFSKMPRIHVYAFSTNMESPVHDVIVRAARYLNCTPSALRYKKECFSHQLYV